jgi:hypothetical protein
MGCGSSQLDPHELVDGFDGLAVACSDGDRDKRIILGGAPGSEPRTSAALLLESIALRHQIAVFERSRTRRPCFRLWDRLFWILFSRRWPQWRDSLIVVQSETVLRWRRDGWSALWRYRARGRWRGGRPRISSEVRHLTHKGGPRELSVGGTLFRRSSGWTMIRLSRHCGLEHCSECLPS